MAISAELRWFREDSVPVEVRDWFRRAYQPIREDPRVDVYLLTSSRDLGVKLRQQRIEIKQRIEVQAPEMFRPGIEGRLERWIKWSCALGEKHSPMPAEEDHWLPVKKERLLKKFEVTEDDRIEPAATPVDQGCNVELTSLDVRGQAWWSLGLEAFGSAERVERNLRRVLRVVLSDPSFPLFEASRSFGFPEWLALSS
jgi:hypothetical protein